MILRRLSIVNYKNIVSAALDFSAGLNCLVGENGAGKTNVLDAIHFLSMCRSSLGTSDRANVRDGADFFVVEGEYSDDLGRGRGVSASFSKGGKKGAETAVENGENAPTEASGGRSGVPESASGARSGVKKMKCDGKEYDRLSDHVGVVPMVMVSPADTFLISDAADERRRWLNSFISQLDRPYLQALVRYNAVLAERNRLLKDGSGGGFGGFSGGPGGGAKGEILDILDAQLVAHGGVIHARRAEIVEQMRPLVARYYARLADDREQVEMTYRSELNDRSFGEILAAGRDRDFANGFTVSGIHRDDIVMKIGGHPLRRYGSQGQQKSFLVALKLAQFAVVRDVVGERPILLLDDLFDKLDTGRVERLIGLVSEGLGLDVTAGTGDFGLEPDADPGADHAENSAVDSAVSAAATTGSIDVEAASKTPPQVFISDCNRARLEAILQRGGHKYSLFEITNGVCDARER